MVTADYNNDKYLFDYPTPEEVISLIKKPAFKRSVREVALLINYIQRANLMIFQTETGSNSNVRDLIARALPFFQLVKKDAGTALFHLDQYLDTLYILVQGSAKGFNVQNGVAADSESKKPTSQLDFSSPPALYKGSQKKKTMKMQSQFSFEEGSSPRQPNKMLTIETNRIWSDTSQQQPNTPSAFDNGGNLLLKNSSFSTNSAFYFNFAPQESFEEKTFGSFSERKHQYFSGNTLKVKQVANYANGAIIGEKDFLSESGIASTAVITYEECYLLTLKRRDYDLLFADEINRMKDKINFLEKVFPQFSRAQLAMVSYFFEKMFCRNEQVIYKQDQKADAVYLVQKGEIQLYRSIHVEGEAKIDKALIKGNKTIYKAAALYEGELFGEDLFSKKKIHLYSAKVTNIGTILYRVEEQNVERMRNLFNEFYVCFRKMLRIKAIAREDGFKEFCQEHNLFEDYGAFFMAMREQQNVAQEMPITLHISSGASKDTENLLGYISLPKKQYLPKISMAKYARENATSFSDYLKKDKQFMVKLRHLAKGDYRFLTEESSPKHFQTEPSSEFGEHAKIATTTRPRPTAKNLSNVMRQGNDNEKAEKESPSANEQGKYKTRPFIKNVAKLSLNMKSFTGEESPSWLHVETPQHKDVQSVKSRESVKTFTPSHFSKPSKLSKINDLKNSNQPEITYFSPLSGRFIPRKKSNPTLIFQKASYPSSRSASNPNILVNFIHGP